jgi:hypothetical protein
MVRFAALLSGLPGEAGPRRVSCEQRAAESTGGAQWGGRATSGSPRLVLRRRVVFFFRLLPAVRFLRFVVRFFARFFRFAIARTSPVRWFVPRPPAQPDRHQFRSARRAAHVT